MNLKFIGHSFLRIKKFLARPKWETIWTCKAQGWNTRGGDRISETTLVCVVQVDRTKNKFKSYMTNGTMTEDVDINFLISESPELKEILKRNGINI